MKKWSTYLSSLFLLLLFSGAALADASNPTIYSSSVAQKTDVSIAFLSSVFGTVSGVLTGTSGQMMGKLLYQFNQGLLVVAGCWLAFSVLTMIFKSATTGSFMQQDNKVPMILLRVALGFALLIPNPSTGYTLLQGIVMQVTVQGVKLANQVWEYGLDYMKAGGALWSRPVQKGSTGTADATSIMSDSDFNAVLGKYTPTTEQMLMPDNFSSDYMGMVQKIMVMEACMVQMSIDITTPADGDSDSPSSSTPLSIYEDTDNYKFEFPAGYATNTRSMGCGAVYWNSLVGKSTLSACGTTPNPDGSCSSENSDQEFSHLAVKEVIYGLLPAVKKYVCLANNANQSSVCSGVESSGDDTYMTDAMFNAVLSFKNLIDPIVRKDALAQTNAALTGAGDGMNFYSQAKKDGWMVAGRYYWDLMRVEDKYDSAVTINGSYGKYIPANYVIPNTIGTGTLPAADAFTVAATPLMQASVGEADSQGGTDGYIKQVRNLIDNYTGSASSGNAAVASMSKSLSSVTSLKIFTMVAGPIKSVILDFTMLIMSFSAYTGTFGLGAEPIFWLHKLGLTCISLGVNIWFALAVAIIPASLVTGFCSAVSPASSTWKNVLDWLQPVIMMASAAFIAIGFSLGFYVPLYPYMIFTFGVIGWIIAVIEAMVAAPLVALGVTHPEGHDFLGRATQGMMLLVGLFLRPVLMLIGLFASMILCQVAMSIILYTFSGFCADLFYFVQPISGQPTSGDPILQAAGNVMGNVFTEGQGSGFGMLIMTMLVFPLFLGIFTMLVYTATVTSFSLVHQLPDYIMAWIGGPQHHGASAKDMVGDVKQGISTAGHKLGDALSHTKSQHKGEGSGGVDLGGANSKPAAPGTGKSHQINKGKQAGKQTMESPF